MKADAPRHCPWRGLDSYGPGDASLLFGRERSVRQIERVLSANGLVGVVGASGSGKSSLLLAGLASLGHRVAMVRPSGEPSLALGDVDRLDDATTVLVVDQMEEIFSLCDDEAERSAFIAKLVDLVARGHKVAVGLRSDRYGDCAAYPEFADLLSRGHLLLASPSEAELRTMVLGPAEVGDVQLDDDLVAEIIDDVLGQPAVLPLLSHALTQTWANSNRRRMTLADYGSVGGVRGSIALAAEQMWQGLDRSDCSAVREVLVSLADPTGASLDLGRRSPVAEVAPPGNQARARAVTALVTARLVTVDGPWIEIAHEAVFREWPRLRQWLHEDREAVAAVHVVREASRSWDREGRDPANLLRGPRLELARELLDRWPGRLDELARTFVHSSLQARSDELVAAEQRITEQRRQNRRLLALVAVVVALALGVGAVAVSARRARDQADAASARATEAADVANARRLAAVSASARDDRLDLGALLAVESSLRHDDPDTRGALLAASVDRPELRYYVAHGGGASGVAIDQGTGNIVMARRPGVVEMLNVTAAPVVRWASTIGEAWPSYLRFLDDGDVLIADSFGSMHRLNGGTGEVEVSRVVAPETPLSAMALAPDEGYVVVGDEAGLVYRLDPETLEATGTALQAHEGVVHAIALSPDGRVITGSDDGTVRQWSTSDLRQAAPAIELGVEVWSMELAPDARSLAVGSDPALLFVDLDAGEVVGAPIEPHDGIVFTVTWVSGGAELMTSGENGDVAFWDPVTHQPTRRALRGHSASTTAIAIDETDGLLVTVSEDTRTAVWDLAGIGGLATGLRTQEGVRTVVTLADGTILTGAEDGTIARWTADGTAIGGPVSVVDGAISDLAASPEGDVVALVTIDGRAVVLDGALQPTLEEITLGTRSVSVDLSPDGRWMAAVQTDGDCDRCVHLVDLRTGQEGLIGSPREGTKSSASSAALFSPDSSVIYTSNQVGWVEAAEVPSGKVRWHVEVNRPLRSMAVSADGSSVAIGGTGGLLWVLDAETGERTANLLGHRGRVGGLSFDPSGGHLASISLEDSTLRLWDLTNNLTVGVPIWLGVSTVSHPAWSPDGRMVIAPHSNGGAVGYSLSLDHMRSSACTLAGRALTTEEWSQYVPDGEPYRDACAAVNEQ